MASSTALFIRNLVTGTSDYHDDEQHHHNDGEIHEKEDVWLQAMIGCFCVFLVTFSGVALLAAARICLKVKQLSKSVTHLMIPSFASGALIATIIFLLLPESIELLQKGGKVTGPDQEYHRMLSQEGEEEHEAHDDDHSFVWKVGTCFIIGFALPMILHAFLPAESRHRHLLQQQQQQDHRLPEEDLVLFEPKGTNDEDKETGQSIKEEKSTTSGNDNAAATFPGECDTGDCCHQPDAEECGKPESIHIVRNWALITSIMISDFLCNFADGVFIGTGFLLCAKSSVAYAIVISSVYHEIAQEISDFMLLTHTCGLTISQALIMNALQGTAVFFGAILVLASNPGQATIGALLAFSAGVFMHIISSECVPKIQLQLLHPGNAENGSAVRRVAIYLVCFALGAIPIGLVLINHGHC